MKSLYLRLQKICKLLSQERIRVRAEDGYYFANKIRTRSMENGFS